MFFRTFDEKLRMDRSYTGIQLILNSDRRIGVWEVLQLKNPKKTHKSVRPARPANFHRERFHTRVERTNAPNMSPYSLILNGAIGAGGPGKVKNRNKNPQNRLQTYQPLPARGESIYAGRASRCEGFARLVKVAAYTGTEI